MGGTANKIQGMIEIIDIEIRYIAILKHAALY